MSVHPYRQKAAGSSAPYPVENLGDSPPAVIRAISPAGNTDLDPPSPLLGPLSESSQLNTARIPSDFGSPEGIAVHSPKVRTMNQHNPNGNFPHPEYISSPSSAPYPAYAPLSPPPVFANLKEHGLVSPNSNPLLATSSVTNLNLSQSIDLHAVFLKSESNLLGANPPGFPKYGHTRSVSSTSSFIHDRADVGSIVDFNQNVIQQYLGSNSSHLLPRIKTIDMYRKNAKKSNDPTVLFQYAQYMLQTALLLDSDPNAGSMLPSPGVSPAESPRKLSLNADKGKKRTKSADFSLTGAAGLTDAQLKNSLLKEAVFYLRKLSDKGYVDAQYLLGDAHSSGALSKVDNREAFSLFQAAAKHGHIESAYRTSYCYEEGLGTGRDARKAVEYLRIAASKNHPASMYKLGVYSFYGRMGLPSNLNTQKMGIKWLTRASNVANELIAAAPYELGKIYFDGFLDIVIADRKYALELYAQAASLGHIDAAAILGKCYEVGDIVPQDSNLSIHYYTQAALGGDPESMLAMCAWYLVGNEPFLPKDTTEAFEWAKRAALCGLPKAQFALGNFYDKGIGCSKMPAEAQKWYQKAAESGDEKALGRLNDKEAAARLQKLMKKKKSTNNLNGGSSKQVSAEEKDCVIM